MDVQVRKVEKGVVVAPSGDVDLSSSRELQSQIKSALQGKPGRLVVDLVGVGYMDSSGVATLVEAMQIARRQSTDLILCNMQDKVRSIFEIARLDRVFKIAASLDAATA